MHVDFPSPSVYTCHQFVTGSTSSVYGYSSNRLDRVRYVLYEGKLYQDGAVVRNNSGYNISGLCLEDVGGIIYKPEVQVYFPFMAFCAISAILLFIYHVIIKRLLP